MSRLLALLVALASLFPTPSATAQNGKASVSHTPVTHADRKAVIQAIEDEIYDWGCQKHVEFVGKEVTHGTYELRVYINPQFDDGRGEVIYKFMPFGEIYRSFWIGDDGLANFIDTPRQGFGPERPSYKTVYMDDDELVKDKQVWWRGTFTIQFHPGKERLAEARRRQHKRVGAMDEGHYKDCPV